jgi:ethanolamine utilization protein EutQ (cupin superfamily)
MEVKWRFGLATTTPFPPLTVHDYDEYMVVVQGCYTLVFGENRVAVGAGEEYLIPRGLWHGGEVAAGTRTIHAFGGRRAERARQAAVL